ARGGRVVGGGGVQVEQRVPPGGVPTDRQARDVVQPHPQLLHRVARAEQAPAVQPVGRGVLEQDLDQPGLDLVRAGQVGGLDRHCLRGGGDVEVDADLLCQIVEVDEDVGAVDHEVLVDVAGDRQRERQGRQPETGEGAVSAE